MIKGLLPEWYDPRNKILSKLNLKEIYQIPFYKLTIDDSINPDDIPIETLIKFFRAHSINKSLFG